MYLTTSSCVIYTRTAVLFTLHGSSLDTVGDNKLISARHTKQKTMKMYVWWSLCTLYLIACQVEVTVGDSGLCCCVCVTSFQR